MVLVYAAALTLLPAGSLAVHFCHALAWCAFHCLGLGLVLRAQSQNKFLVRHYLKHYHYPHNDRGQGAVHEAFQNWKQVYNTSMCMMYGEWMAGVECVCCGADLRAFSLGGWPGLEDVLATATVDRRR